MRSTRCEYVAVLAVLAVTSVAGMPGPQPGPQPGTQSATPRVTTPLEAVVSELRAFSGATTFGAWRPIRPNDAMRPPELGSGESPGVATWTRFREPVAMTTSASLASPDGSRFSRTVFCYRPPITSIMTPPTPDAAPSVLVDQAVAGYLWMETHPADAAAAARLTAELRAAFDAAFGPGDAQARLFAFGAASWKDTSMWRAGDAEIGLGWTTRFATVAPPATVIVIASLPASRSPLKHTGRDAVEIATSPMARRNAERRDRVRARVDEALSLAGVGGAPEAGIRPLLSYVAPDVFFETRPAGDPDMLLEVYRAWMSAAQNLPAPRRAAALFVADQVFQGAMHPFKVAVYAGPDAARSAGLREAFGALGARFTRVELGATYLYTNTWIKDALALDPDGRAGELAFLTLLAKGFETSGVCADQRGEGFNAVIREGERYLQGNRPRAPADRTTVLFALGEAYTDIVALATGHGYEGPGGSEARKFAAGATRAREQALRYYRLALAAETDSERSQDAWTEVWRLSAGLSPSRRYFYCVYD